MDRANHGVKDANFVTTKALPNGAAAVQTSGFNLGLFGSRGARMEDCELLISAPALTTTELPDTKTMKYDLQMDTVSNFASPTTIAKELIVQTGAGGVGAAAATARVKIPTPCEQYIRAVATNDGTGDASGSDVTFSLLF
jgi:hypothetical protein